MATNTGLFEVVMDDPPAWLQKRLDGNRAAHASRRVVLGEWGDGRDRVIAGLPPRQGNIYRRVVAEMPKMALQEVMIMLLQAPTVVDDEIEEAVEVEEVEEEE